MEQKCCGIKILDLEEKKPLTGTEYLLVAEKGNDYKAPVNLLVDLVTNYPGLLSELESWLQNKFEQYKSEANVEGSLEEFRKQLQQLSERVNALETKFGQLESKLNSLEEKYNSLNQSLTELQSSVQSLTQQITQFGSDYGDLSTAVSETKIKEIVNKGISDHSIDILNPVQTAINSGCDIQQPMPKDNNYKILLNTWIGSEKAYTALESKMNGMIYNVIEGV